MGFTVSLYRDEAVVLRTWKLGEADRIVNLYTSHNGKVRGVAKGIRRTRSKFGARLEPMSHVAVQLYQGRSELETITQVETIDRFAGLRSDPVRFARASALVEAVDQIVPDRQPDPTCHLMLVRALSTVDESDSPLVAAAFMLKLLAHDGVQPALDRCVSCGAAEPLVTIDFHQGGVTCRRLPVGPARQLGGAGVAARHLRGPARCCSQPSRRRGHGRDRDPGHSRLREPRRADPAVGGGAGPDPALTPHPGRYPQ